MRPLEDVEVLVNVVGAIGWRDAEKVQHKVAGRMNGRRRNERDFTSLAENGGEKRVTAGE